VVAEYPEKPSTKQGLVAQTMDGGFSLRPLNQYEENDELNYKESQRYETVPEHISVSSAVMLKWKIYVDEPGEKTMHASYSFQGSSHGGNLKAVAADQVIEHTVLSTGKTVGEPNADWVIDSFESHQVGKVNFPLAGVYEITLELEPNNGEEINFQWIWIK